MSFWPVVLCALIGAPLALFMTGMGAIFAAGGYANGGRASSVKVVVGVWLALAWVLLGVFGAFGLAPAWRAWHGGHEDFAGGLQAFADWLVGVGVAGALGAAVLHIEATMDRERWRRPPLRDALRWLVLAICILPWAALVAWIAWPLVLWPLQGRFEWPGAATGWTHTGEVFAVLAVATLVEEAVRKRRGR